MDYRKYRFTAQEHAICTAEVFVISGVAAYLFYQSILGFAVILVLFPLFIREQRVVKAKKRRNQLDLEFKECIHAAAGALLAGYSIENAFLQAGKEMQKLYGEGTMIVRELNLLQLRLNRNETLEKILRDFSVRSGSEEIGSFTEVFSFAKRGGGDFVQIMQTTTERISDKIEIHQEIQTVLAAKEMEQKIMCVVPLGILLFFQLTSPDFLQCLYGNVTGVVIMTAALVVYGISIKLSSIIIDIEV